MRIVSLASRPLHLRSSRQSVAAIIAIPPGQLYAILNALENLPSALALVLPLRLQYILCAPRKFAPDVGVAPLLLGPL